MHSIKPLIKQYVSYRAIDLFRSPKKFLHDALTDLKSLFGAYRYPYRIVFVVGLPKSGTTWVENFLYHVPGYVARPIYGDDRCIKNHGLPGNGLKYFSSSLYSYVKTHLDPTQENIRLLREKGIEKVLIIVRDPRDVAVSRYFHLLKNPKAPDEPNSVDYNTLPREEGVSHSIDMILKYYVDWMSGWLEEAKKFPERYCVVRYEDLLDERLRQFKRINDFYRFDLSDAAIETILDTIDAEMKQGFNVNASAGTRSTFRQGGAGGWRKYFSAEDIENFKLNAGKKLVAFGYEKDLDW